MAVKDLGALVKKHRLANLLTQPQMALEMDVSISTIVRIEKGDAVSDLTRARVEQYLRNAKKGEAA